MKAISYLVSLLLLILSGNLHGQVVSSTSVGGLRPIDFFTNPQLLRDGQLEAAIPKEAYTPQEATIQSALNHKAADALLVWSPLAGEQEWTEYDTEPITPFTWRWVDMEVQHYDGAASQVHLLRPIWWLSDMGADVVDNVLFVEMPEVGITGEAHVTNIRPTQLDTRFWDENRQGDFVSRPITGKFEHTSSDVYHLFFGRDTVPLGVTGNHRIWSKDRKDWVEAAHLLIGEAVLTRDGETTLTARQKLPNEHTVYNLEVYRDHNFLVSVQGVVVHNTCKVTGLKDYKKWKSTEPDMQGDGAIADIEAKLRAGDLSVFSEPINTTTIKGQTYILDGHHRVQAAKNVGYDKLNHMEVSLEDLSKATNGRFKSAQDVLDASGN